MRSKKLMTICCANRALINISPSYLSSRIKLPHHTLPLALNLYYLQHERPCCIGYTNYNTDANVVNDLKNDSSYEFIGEVILKINVVYAEKIKVKVYINQHESVSHIQIRHAYDFSLCFLHELLMIF